MPNENEQKDGTHGSEQGSTAKGQHGAWHEHQAGEKDREQDVTETESNREPGATEFHKQSSANVGGGSTTSSQTPRPKQRRGFAAMDPAKQKEIASKGGKASHALGTGHEWNSDSAREAGRKGGQASRGGRGKLPPGSPGSESGGEE